MYRKRWRARLARDGRPREEVVADMNAANPVVIPRNHQIAKAISKARDGDYAHFHAVRTALADPWTDRPELEPFKAPPEPDEVVHRTFCGT